MDSDEDSVPELSEYFSSMSKAVKARIEKLDMFHKYTRAMMREDFSGMLEALKFPQELLEDMTYPEILEAMVVRVADLAKEVGFDFNDSN